MITKDEMLKMAKQAGFMACTSSEDGWYECFPEEIEAFTKLVTAKAVEREREACAKVADECTTWNRNAAETIAAAIRARSNND